MLSEKDLLALFPFNILTLFFPKRHQSAGTWATPCTRARTATLDQALICTSLRPILQTFFHVSLTFTLVSNRWCYIIIYSGSHHVRWTPYTTVSWWATFAQFITTDCDFTSFWRRGHISWQVLNYGWSVRSFWWGMENLNNHWLVFHQNSLSTSEGVWTRHWLCKLETQHSSSQSALGAVHAHAQDRRISLQDSAKNQDGST